VNNTSMYEDYENKTCIAHWSYTFLPQHTINSKYSCQKHWGYLNGAWNT
jgi:hypothetical protein